MTTLTRRIAAGAAAAALSLSMVACSDSQDVSDSVADATSAAGSAAAEATSAAGSAVDDATSSNDAAGEAPCAPSDYTQEARDDLAAENITEEEVASTLERACAGEGTTEADEDNGQRFFEVEVDNVKVDVTPEGLVTEVDR